MRKHKAGGGHVDEPMYLYAVGVCKRQHVGVLFLLVLGQISRHSQKQNRIRTFLLDKGL